MWVERKVHFENKEWYLGKSYFVFLVKNISGYSVQTIGLFLLMSNHFIWTVSVFPKHLFCTIYLRQRDGVVLLKIIRTKRKQEAWGKTHPLSFPLGQENKAFTLFYLKGHSKATWQKEVSQKSFNSLGFWTRKQNYLLRKIKSYVQY